MFDIAWTEILLIGGVALVLIGPKDLPVAIKAVTELIKKARRMASEFQTHVDDMMKDADLKDVRDSISELRRMDIKGKILRAVDGDGTIRSTLNDAKNDFAPPPPPVPVHDTPAPAAAVDGSVKTAELSPDEVSPVSDAVSPVADAVAPLPEAAVPAFVPPLYRPKPPRPRPPAFVPPQTASSLNMPERLTA